MGRTDVPNVVSLLYLAPVGLHNVGLRSGRGGGGSGAFTALKAFRVSDRHPTGPRLRYNRFTLPSAEAWVYEVSGGACADDCP